MTRHVKMPLLTTITHLLCERYHGTLDDVCSCLYLMLEFVLMVRIIQGTSEGVARAAADETCQAG